MSCCLGGSCEDDYKLLSQTGGAALGEVPREVRISILWCLQAAAKQRHRFTVGSSLAAVRRLNWRPLEALSTNSKYNSGQTFAWKKL